jgi:hypothetical protein
MNALPFGRRLFKAALSERWPYAVDIDERGGETMIYFSPPGSSMIIFHVRLTEDGVSSYPMCGLSMIESFDELKDTTKKMCASLAKYRHAPSLPDFVRR